MTRLKEIRDRLNAATPGPWIADIGNCDIHSTESGWHVAYVGSEEDRNSDIDYRDDAAFIAHAPEDIAYLLARCERLEEALKFYATHEFCGEVTIEGLTSHIKFESLGETARAALSEESESK